MRPKYFQLFSDARPTHSLFFKFISITSCNRINHCANKWLLKIKLSQLFWLNKNLPELSLVQLVERREWRDGRHLRVFASNASLRKIKKNIYINKLNNSSSNIGILNWWEGVGHFGEWHFVQNNFLKNKINKNCLSRFQSLQYRTALKGDWWRNLI